MHIHYYNTAIMMSYKLHWLTQKKVQISFYQE